MRPVPNDGKFSALSRGKISEQSNKYFFLLFTKFWKILVGSILPPLGLYRYHIIRKYIYNFFIFWDFKKRTTPSWSVNFSRFFDVSSSKSHIFSQKFSFFLTDLTKKFEKNFQKFVQARDLRPVQTTANFVLYHVVKFQLNRISTFFAIYKTNFHF